MQPVCIQSTVRINRYTFLYSLCSRRLRVVSSQRDRQRKILQSLYCLSETLSLNCSRICTYLFICFISRLNQHIIIQSESLPVKYRNIAWRSSQTLLKDAQMSMKYRYVHEKMYRRAVSKKIESLERSLRESQRYNFFPSLSVSPRRSRVTNLTTKKAR